MAILSIGSDAKTVKGEAYGVLTAVQYLAPGSLSGHNVCPSASQGCLAGCLYTAGRGAQNGTQASRLARAAAFFSDRQGYMVAMEREIRLAAANAARKGFQLAVRPNGTSDLPWEKVMYNGPNGRTTIIDRFPEVQFYDYSKLAYRFTRELPANYDLTFSLSESNDEDALRVLAAGGRVAAVFGNTARPTAKASSGWALPETWTPRGSYSAWERGGFPVVNGDLHDIVYKLPAGVIVGLRAKGRATKDSTGFVRWI